ncbi:DUF6783 domain-containing protein [Lachnospiraceae bacterium JLR.KK009]
MFAPNSVNVSRYASLIWHKSSTNCEIHPTESNFKTRSRERLAAAVIFQIPHSQASGLS